MEKRYRIAKLQTKVVINADVLKDRLKDILEGMESYREHRNMTWLKHKMKGLIKDVENEL